MERTLGIPNEAYNFHLFQSDAQIKSHASYYAGKAGDTDAALRLVDDVSSMGTTLAELANYLQVNGGRVAGTLLLVNAGRSTAFKPAAKHIRLLEERYGEEIRQIFGIHTRALTANEAGYLVGFRTADEIRNRLVKAEKETRLRLLSKGY